MFELSVALKYLIPRRKSLSMALVSAVSVVVISLVVWLVLVFLSVTTGMEHNWLQKLTSLHAPVRISPTDAYYRSYFYQVDASAAASNFNYKTIGEKQETSSSDPYAADLDPELPIHCPKAERLFDGRLRDPVKIAFQKLSEIPDLTFQDYEISGALMRLTLRSTATLSQMSYLLSIPDQNPKLRSLIIDPVADFDKAPPSPPPHVYFVKGQLHLPDFGEQIPVLLPKNYRDSGVEWGDRGTLNYQVPTATSLQEQKIPIRVAGFYDPGVMAMGNKCLLVPKKITRTLYGAAHTFSPDGTPTNGIFVWFPHIDAAKKIQEEVIARFKQAGIEPYWKVATYEDFEFAKDLLQQFQSDRTLLLLIATILLFVACCNIISLLILLVNDKKKEIAILQSMGASFRSIALIFGSCGVIMGMVSCLLGSALAVFTLHHLDGLVSFLSALQGRTAFNPAFFGKSLPNQLSTEALLFVLIATPLLSLIAGLIPAIKASRIRPSIALRAE